MDNLTGKWVGQYAQIDPKDNIIIDSFEFQLKDVEGEITGTSIDLDLNNEPGVISGFYENGILSIIKKYHRLVYYDEEGNIFTDDQCESDEICYTATYNGSEKAFEGVWEIHIEGKQKGFQEEYIDEFDQGDFFMRKIE